MTTGESIARSARGWIGTPYLHQGRTRNGIDCIGLLLVVAHELGISDYESTEYSRNPSGRRMARLLGDNLSRIPFPEARVGDVLHLATPFEPQHVAILTRDDPRYVIHADSNAGRVVEVRLDARFLRLIRGAYRVPGSS